MPIFRAACADRRQTEGAIMKIAAAIVVVAGSLTSFSVMAADMALKAPGSAASCDPYANYSCLNAYLGDDFLTRLYRYYALESGHDGPPTDPKAPPSRRSEAASKGVCDGGNPEIRSNGNGLRS